MLELNQKARSLRTTTKLWKGAKYCTYSHECIIKSNNNLEKRPILLQFSFNQGLKQSEILFYTELCCRDVCLRYKICHQKSNFGYRRNSSKNLCEWHFQKNGRYGRRSGTHFLSSAMADSIISVVASSLRCCCHGSQSIMEPRNLL